MASYLVFHSKYAIFASNSFDFENLNNNRTSRCIGNRIIMMDIDFLLGEFEKLIKREQGNIPYNFNILDESQTLYFLDFQQLITYLITQINNNPNKPYINVELLSFNFDFLNQKDINFPNKIFFFSFSFVMYIMICIMSSCFYFFNV